MNATASNQRVETQGTRKSILYAVAALLSLVGLADSIYLTVEHLSGRSVLCTIVSGCSEVLSSPYATIGSVPLALVGAAAYFTAFSLATLATFGNMGAAKLLTVVTGLMFLVTLWLLYIQAFVIGSFCQFCLLSAAVTTGLLGIALIASRLSR
ncbi:MAG TPA: vitamin K epoxide reductase family protein, partial [Pyrinomonadaceae bacterium]|nr:vitamin K epoxide reductase family protein [Pyrinomonadaceae bacterium]